MPSAGLASNVIIISTSTKTEAEYKTLRLNGLDVGIIVERIALYLVFVEA
jgi:hypothetical protein